MTAWPKDENKEEFQRALATMKEMTHECPELCRSEVELQGRAFIDHFVLPDGAGGYHEIPNQEVRVPWGAFSSQVTKKGLNTEEKGVFLHYGLDENDEFILMISVAIQGTTARPDSIPCDTANATYYVVKGHALHSSSASNMRIRKQRYFNRVRVYRTDTSTVPEALGPNDYLSYALPWDQEVYFLGHYNEPLDSRDVVFSNLARNESVTAVQDYKHVMSIHLDGWLTDDPIPAGKYYYRRAANLGTPCPPRCGRVAWTGFVACPDRNACAPPTWR